MLKIIFESKKKSIKTALIFARYKVDNHTKSPLSIN